MKEGQSRLKRRLLWISICVICILIAIGVLLIPRPPRVTTSIVRQTALANKIFATGSVKPLTRQVIMPQQLTSPIEKVDVSLGSRVHVGDPLIELNHETQAAALTAAKVAVDQAQQTLADTLTQQTAAPSAFQAQFSGTLHEERASLAQAQAQLAEAQAAYDATIVKANIDGTVVVLNPDGIGADGSPSAVLEVVGNSRQIVLQVSEVDAVQMKPGMSAEVTADAFPNQQWKATVKRVAEFAVTSSSGTGQVEVDLTPPANFTVPYGYQVDVHIITQQKQKVPVIPYAAVVQDGSAYSVFVVSEGHVHKTEVQLGITTDTAVEVTKGLNVGDQVVVNPPASLTDGQAVRLS